MRFYPSRARRSSCWSTCPPPVSADIKVQCANRADSDAAPTYHLFSAAALNSNRNRNFVHMKGESISYSQLPAGAYFMHIRTVHGETPNTVNTSVVRTRRYLTGREVEKLMEAARTGSRISGAIRQPFPLMVHDASFGR